MKPKCCKNKDSLNELSKIEEFLRVISEENRLKIICILKKEEKCVCEIYKHLDLPQNLVSYHLKALKEMDLILAKKQGKKIFYKLNNKKIKKNIKTLNKFINI